MAIEIPSSLATTASQSPTANGQHKSFNSDDYHDNEQESLKSNKPATASSRSISHLYTTYTTSIKHFATLHQNVLPIIGLFIFYIGHDALQERMFRFVDFKYGFFMTLVEVLIMLLFSNNWCTCNNNTTTTQQQPSSTEQKETQQQQRNRKRRSIPMDTILQISIVGILLALAHGLGNTALRYSSYPLKVAFKSCKLVPTMALGACVTGRKHTALQYIAALIMGMGLAVLTAADVFNSKTKLSQLMTIHHHDTIGPMIGPILLAISTILDSVVPNLQENLLQSAQVNTSELIFVSNAIMCLFLIIYTIYSGELVDAWYYCQHHYDALFILTCQGLCAYFGLQCYLAIIRDHGGVAGVLFANGRKVCTILLSFVLFSKPFNVRHFLGLVLVFVGVYLGYKGKQQQQQKNKNKKKSRESNNRKSHDHNV